MKTVSERLSFYRKQKGISLGELSKITGIPKTNLQRYEKGTTKKIPMDIIPIIEKALLLEKGTLMGWAGESEESSIIPLNNDCIFMIPKFDSVSAGFGALAEDNIIEYIPTYLKSKLEKQQYIWVSVTGDSMYPTIEDGSDILVRKQTSVDSGQIAVALIDGDEAVVKRVVYGDDWIELQSVNPQYAPRRFKGAEVKRISILGIVKKVSKDLQ